MKSTNKEHLKGILVQNSKKNNRTNFHAIINNKHYKPMVKSMINIPVTSIPKCRVRQPPTRCADIPCH